MKRNLMLIAVLTASLLVFSQQQHFKKQIPPGNYSGICALGHDRYAVVSDKAETDGFFIFRFTFDSIQGRITEAANEGYHSSGLPNRDMEAICYRSSSNTIFISGEADQEVYEYTMDGKRTGQRLAMPDIIRQASHNYGLESLTYDAHRHLFFTTTEHPLPGDSLLRIMVFDDDLQLRRQYFYTPDPLISRKYIHGVSELCALDNGRLLVLERQIRVPRLKLGACTITRIYAVIPGQNDYLEKKLVTEFKTRLTITSCKFANFEGLCQLSSRHLLLIADSQNQYKGFLRDWLRITTIAPAD